MNRPISQPRPLSSLAARHALVRQASMNLVAPLSTEDCQVQSMPDASPAKWHLAHTTWFFETFILERFEPNFRPFDPAFRVLFNSYYQGVGERFPRPKRGLMTHPTLADVKRYRRRPTSASRRCSERPLARNRGSRTSSCSACSTSSSTRN